MKNYLLKMKENSRHNSRWRQTHVLLVWIFCAFLFLFFGTALAERFAVVITTPILYIQHYFKNSAAPLPLYLKEKSDLIAQIRLLEEERNTQIGITLTAEYLKQENESLKSLMQNTTTPGIVAGVIGRPPYTPYDSIIIDQGSRDGIVLNAPVFYGVRKVLGYVDKVYERTSRVSLFSSPAVASTVYIMGPNIFASAYGLGGGVLRVSVPQGITLAVGNPVILPTVHGGSLGSIQHITSVPSEPEQNAFVTFDVPMQSIRLVSVGTDAVVRIDYREAQLEVEKNMPPIFTVDVPRVPDGATTTGTSTAAI